MNQRESAFTLAPNASAGVCVPILFPITSNAVLDYASANRISTEAACHELKEASSANRLREVLAKALPDGATVQRVLNRILRAQTPRFVKKGKRSYYLAIDLTLIPYHGECYEDEKEIMRSQANQAGVLFDGES